MTFEELKEQYKKDLELQEEIIDTQALQLPKIMAKYQFFYSDLLSKLSDIQDVKDSTYHLLFMDYKMGNSDLSNLVLNSSELKQMLMTSSIYRKELKKENEISNQLKLVEEMISNIKGMSFSVNNYINYKKIIMGV